jgi:hypothetical protein
MRVSICSPGKTWEFCPRLYGTPGSGAKCNRLYRNEFKRTLEKTREAKLSKPRTKQPIALLTPLIAAQNSHLTPDT